MESKELFITDFALALDAWFLTVVLECVVVLGDGVVQDVARVWFGVCGRIGRSNICQIDVDVE